MLIATGSTKGGCGKTTTAVCLATCAAAKGKTVLLIDGDLQQSSLYWKGNRDDAVPGAIDVYALPSNKMHTTLPRMAAMYDVVIIDVGGTKETKVLGSAMLSCGKGVVRPEGGIVLIPCKPSQLDLWGLTDTLEVLDTARSFVDGGIEARILLNQLVHGTSVSGKAAEAIAGFEEVPMLQTRIHNRVAFANAIERGCGVNEIEPNGKAALEIEHLWNELCAIHETMKGAV